MNEWVYTKDRKPTKEDANHNGWVLVPHANGKDTVFRPFDSLSAQDYAWKTPDAAPPKPEEWRPPTWDDLKNGPIEARFRDRPQESWVFDDLVGMRSEGERYVSDKSGAYWRYCEIKVNG